MRQMVPTRPTEEPRRFEPREPRHASCEADESLDSWSIRSGPVVRRSGRDSESFTKHVVVAQEGHAADIGRDVLRAGGNAVDAAVATAFALAVTLPEAGNLGGGGFIVAYLADRKEVVTVDFREMAPRCVGPADVPGCRREAPARDIGPVPGRPACRGRSAAWGWPMPAGGSGPGPSWSGRLPGWHARASRSPPTWPAP